MSKDRQSALLAKIRRETPMPTASSAAMGAAPKAASKAGRGAQFWLHDEDRRIIRELYAWLANQGERPKDSSVVRAALRVAKPGGEFLQAYREAAKQDGRLKS